MNTLELKQTGRSVAMGRCMGRCMASRTVKIVEQQDGVWQAGREYGKQDGVWQAGRCMASRTVKKYGKQDGKEVWQAGREYDKQDESMASRTVKVLLARQEWYLFLKISHKVTAEKGPLGGHILR